MSAPLLFGGCGCGRNSAGAYDSQQVVAFVPFSMGWVGTFRPFNGVTFAVANPLRGSNAQPDRIPDIIFLRLTQGDFVAEYDVFGNLTVNNASAFGDPVLSVPYTFAEAVAAAVGLLGTVQLFSPYTIYQSRLWAAKDSPTYPVNFCYSSEGVLFNKPRKLLHVSWDSNGSVMISDNPDTAPGSPSGVGSIGSSTAQNGIMGRVFNDGLPVYNGFVQVAKSAFRTPIPILSTVSTIFTPGTYQSGIMNPINKNPTVVQPVNLGAGEFVTDPGQVGGYGSLFFSTDPAPGLPSPP